MLSAGLEGTSFMLCWNAFDVLPRLLKAVAPVGAAVSDRSATPAGAGSKVPEIAPITPFTCIDRGD